jgi:signal peptidase
MDQIRTSLNNQHILKIQPTIRRYGWLIIVVWMLVVFLLANTIFPGFLSSTVGLYVLQPLLWISLAALAVGLRMVEGDPLHLFAKRELIISGLMIGGIQTAIAVLLGLLFGFGNSPYARQVIWIILNLGFVASRLIGIEAARWYLGVSAGRKNQALGYGLAWLLPLIFMIPVGSYSLLGQPVSALRMGGQTLLPAAAESMLAALLAVAGGPLASIVYRGVMQGFEWLSPILPNLPWMVAALIGVLVPVFSMFAINPLTAVPAQPAETKKPARENASLTSWLLVGALAVGLIWLNTGAFGVQPGLVSSNSMQPFFSVGDVVVVQRLNASEIKVGDVIRYQRDNIAVVHRVLQIQQSSDGLVFTTKGDNNNAADLPVPETLVNGKVVVIIPKIGWISIGLRQLIGGLVHL